ncbi:COP9/signalosome complex subunit Csn2 [Physocladia obscura]|uniref:COP9/signalosome complex subunit Csn2 n=1 Tax=Physocladia obscura TaxID=109957 RepID=A0AAD5XCY8_9FUNG|nr:COP9/signalosome complex subunit Csn2 [Physocladia obscura]
MLRSIFVVNFLSTQISAIALKQEWIPERDEFSSIEDIARKMNSIKAIGSTFALRDEYPMTECQIEIMLQITNQFENGPTNNGLIYDSCEVTADSQGISAGFIQFTTCCGDLLSLCNDYIQQYQSDKNFFCISYIPALQAANSAPECGEDGNSVQLNMSKYGIDSSFCPKWTETADTNANFRAMQRQTALNEYLGTLQSLIQEYNIKTPGVLAQLFDANVQLGAVSDIAAAATVKANGSPANGTSELTWLGAFLEARTSYTINLGGAYLDTVYRIQAFKGGIYDTGNLNFTDNKIILPADDSWAMSPITITC